MSEIDSSYIGQYVSFDVHPVAVLGTGTYTNVKVLAILDFDSARGLIDPVSMHKNVYPTLPGGTPNDPTAYTYVKIEFENGSKTAIGMPWIVSGSLTVAGANQIVATINSVSAADLTKIRKALVANGYDNISLELVS